MNRSRFLIIFMCLKNFIFNINQQAVRFYNQYIEDAQTLVQNMIHKKWDLSVNINPINKKAFVRIVIFFSFDKLIVDFRLMHVFFSFLCISFCSFICSIMCMFVDLIRRIFQ